MSETTDTKSFRIEYRHMAFFFLGAVCICALFFALGFVVGRAQAFETALSNPEDPKNAEGADSLSGTSGKEELPAVTEVSGKVENSGKATDAVDYRKELDFYAAVKEPKVDQNFHPESPKPQPAPVSEKKPPESKSQTAAAPTGNGTNRAGALSLQVAALRSSTEADRLAKTLRSKGYPVFIVNPAKEDSSKLIRVQIGPYTSEADAAKAKTRLGTDGYTAITKR